MDQGIISSMSTASCTSLQRSLTLALFGPIHVFYEDLHGDLRSLFRGIQNVHMQIMASVCIQQKLPELQVALEPGSLVETCTLR